MNNEKIIETASRYGSFEYGETIWFFQQQEILDFAQTLIEARFAEDDDEPVAWLGEDIDHGCLYYDKQDALDDGCVFIFPVYRRPQPKALLTDEAIEEVHREFPSRIDLFARAIEQKIWEKAE